MTKKKSKDLFLCKLSEIDELASKTFNIKIKRQKIDIFVIRKGDQVFAYQNICPHAQAPLEWNPDQFLDSKKENIVCALHGAIFTIEEGACVDGPCDGKGLTPVDIQLVDGDISLTS